MRTTPDDTHRSHDTFSVTPVEKDFVDRATKAKAKLWRAGWPDFLFELNGQRFGVEVKRGEDRISKTQAAMFRVLELAGLRVYVWSPRMPGALIPWFAYMSIGRTARALAEAERRHASEALSGLIESGFLK